MFIYHTLRPVSFAPESAGPSGLSFYVISVSLNVLLTLMIVIRLILHKKNIQNAIGTTEKPCGLYNAVVTMLVESCALYAVTCLLYIGPWVTGNSAQLLLPPFLNLVQVRAESLLPAHCDPGNLIWQRAGHRPAPHYSTSRQPNRIDKRRHLRQLRFDPFQERRGIDVWWRDNSRRVSHGRVSGDPWRRYWD